MARKRKPHVAVVGAGFTGVLTALHLLKSDPQLCVYLIEKGDVFGRGLAYGAADDCHLLNVRAGNMSAFPDQADHFVSWLRRNGKREGGAGFVSRLTFGSYLQHLLRDVAESDAAPGRLVIVPDEVVAIAADARSLRLAIGRTLDVDAVVLATGNLPPQQPGALSDRITAVRGWIPDPWRPNAFVDLRPTDTIVLIGTGLTATDVVLKLMRATQAKHITAISRRGLTPRAHLDAAIPFVDHANPGTMPLSALLRVVRNRASTEGWHRAIDGLRPYTQRLWHDAPLDKRRRFLRHLRPWWDVHRHRLAPQAAAQIDALVRAGTLDFAAGRIGPIDRQGEQFVVTWTPRGAASTQSLRCDAIINCTGPAGKVQAAKHPLLTDLIEKGAARADPCGLGLDVDSHCRLIGEESRPHPRLFALGPMSRGAFWEVTAVPDIRLQVATIAAFVAAEVDTAG